MEYKWVQYLISSHAMTGWNSKVRSFTPRHSIKADSCLRITNLHRINNILSQNNDYIGSLPYYLWKIFVYAEQVKVAQCSNFQALSFYVETLQGEMSCTL